MHVFFTTASRGIILPPPIYLILYYFINEASETKGFEKRPGQGHTMQKWQGGIGPEESDSSFMGTAESQLCRSPRRRGLLSSPKLSRNGILSRINHSHRFQTQDYLSRSSEKELLTLRLLTTSQLHQKISLDLSANDKQPASMATSPEKRHPAPCPVSSAFIIIIYQLIIQVIHINLLLLFMYYPTY